MRRILCFGDSNTWGYDPRSLLGGRYDLRWTKLLGAEYEVLEAGQNGRAIPRSGDELREAAALLRRRAPLDGFLILLGTNDLLESASAEEAADRMRRFLAAIAPELNGVRVLLIAPPPLRPGAWVTGPELIGRSVRFAAHCRVLAGESGISFADAGEWGVDAVFDGVHFSEAGHRTFAGALQKALAALFA